MIEAQNPFVSVIERIRRDLTQFIEQERLDYKTEAKAKEWRKKYAGYKYVPAQFEITIKNEVEK